MEALDRLLFEAPVAGVRSPARACLLALLFTCGAVHWIAFFAGGRLSLTAYDWVKEDAYLQVLSNALATPRIPWYWDRPFFQGTPDFLGIPEVVLTPDVVLLLGMNRAEFVLCHTLLLYAAGFLGTLMLARRWSASLAAVSLFFLLFNFNGYVVSHLAVGHFQWTGYFLLPWFFWLLLRFTEAERPARMRGREGGLAMPLLLAGLFFNGSFHLAIWCLMLLLLVSLWRWSLLPTLAVSALGAACLAAARWMPAAVSLWGRKTVFLSGYPTLSTVVDAFTSLRTHDFETVGTHSGRLRWWECDVYVGFAGFLLLVIVSAGLVRRREKKIDGAIVAAAAMMFLLSLGEIWSWTDLVPAPLIGVERVSSRFIVMPFLVWLVACLAGADGWLRGAGRPGKGFLLLALPIVTFELALHSLRWRPALLPELFAMKIDAGISPAAGADPAYVVSVYAGWVVSAVSLGLVVAWMTRSRFRAR